MSWAMGQTRLGRLSGDSTLSSRPLKKGTSCLEHSKPKKEENTVSMMVFNKNIYLIRYRYIMEDTSVKMSIADPNYLFIYFIFFADPDPAESAYADSERDPVHVHGEI
jgi:hypothetical protein